MVSVTAGDWVALSALIVSVAAAGSGIVYRGGQLVGTVRDLAGDVKELNARVGAIERQLNRRRPLRTVSVVTVCQW